MESYPIANNILDCFLRHLEFSEFVSRNFRELQLCVLFRGFMVLEPIFRQLADFNLLSVRYSERVQFSPELSPCREVTFRRFGRRKDAFAAAARPRVPTVSGCKPRAAVPVAPVAAAAGLPSFELPPSDRRRRPDAPIRFEGVVRKSPGRPQRDLRPGLSIGSPTGHPFGRRCRCRFDTSV